MTSPPSTPPTAVDFSTQALKLLSERSPNDSEEFDARSANLPVGIARELIKISDTKKKHKKSSSLSHGGQANDSTTFGNEESSKMEKKSSLLWEKMEVYFRAIQESDIQNLPHNGVDESLLFVPTLEKEKVEFQEASLSGKQAVQDFFFEKTEVDSVDTSLCLIPEVLADHKEEEVRAINEGKEKSSKYAYLSWVFCSQKGTTITGQRPTKKRKLLGNVPELELLLKLPHSEKPGSVFCDVCYMHIENTKSNNVVSCNACHVSVHKKCYGVHKAVENPWSCYQCNINLDGKEACMLCPMTIGALKPVSGDDKKENEKKYAHLFCSIWSPETFVKNFETMEPVMNVGALPDIRQNPACEKCNKKHGVCVPCSTGKCVKAFHPICAREARYQMEIWRKVGHEDVELRTYCKTHSTPQEALPPKKPLKLKVTCKGKDILQGSIKQSGSKELINVETPLESPKIADMPSSIPEKEQQPDTPNLISAVNKLVSGGKVGDIASKIGISPDFLKAFLKGESSSISPELRYKIIKFLRESANDGCSSQNLESNNGTSGAAAVDCSNAVAISDTVNVEQLSSLDMDNKAVALIKDMKICPLGENVLQTSEGESAKDIGKVSPHTETEKLAAGKMSPILDTCKSKDEALLRMTIKDSQYTCTFPSLDPDQVQSSEAKGNSNLPGERELSEAQYQSEYGMEYARSNETSEEKERISSSCVHPIIRKKMTQLPNFIFAKKGGIELNPGGQSKEEKISDKSSGSCDQSSSSRYNDLDDIVDSETLDQLTKAKEMGILESSPEDEIEGEIIYLQNKLLDTAVSNSCSFEDLLVRVVEKLPQEVYALKKRQWDLVFVNNYLHKVKEGRKQEKKERKHREAQAVLATATAAAATSSRLLRKDGNPDSENPQANNAHNDQPQRVSITPSSGSRLRENFLPAFCCDICRQPETLLNRLFVCSSCKVAVHVHCYQKIEDPPVGPWKCEMCEEISQFESPTSQGHSGIKCGLCGGEGSGAFRKTTSGQWVHAFCAEWLLESTFERGQSELVDGMDSLPKEKGLLKCSVCHQNIGFCVKCSYGDCQVGFHPTCAKAADLYMSRNVISGSIHHKGYCETHSRDQKLKADDQQFGSEELMSIKHLRFELEKVRLLCERIVRREKIKKEMVVCSQGIIACSRDCIYRCGRKIKGSTLVSGLSSDSATTSLDDGSTCQLNMKKKMLERTSCSGKKLPMRAQTVSFEGEKMKVKKLVENFHKEVVMTSHQATVQNRRLPKGFVYVPIDDSVSKEKPVHDSKPHEPEEPGG